MTLDDLMQDPEAVAEWRRAFEQVEAAQAASTRRLLALRAAFEALALEHEAKNAT